MTEACGHNFCHSCISNLIADGESWNCPEYRSEQIKLPKDQIWVIWLIKPYFNHLIHMFYCNFISSKRL